jgi:hypothetical protein
MIVIYSALKMQCDITISLGVLVLDVDTTRHCLLGQQGLPLPPLCDLLTGLLLNTFFASSSTRLIMFFSFSRHHPSWLVHSLMPIGWGALMIESPLLDLLFFSGLILSPDVLRSRKWYLDQAQRQNTKQWSMPRLK